MTGKLKSMLMLTLSGVLAKTIDFSFRSFWSSRLGEEGMGVFSLVMSAYGIILSLSGAGMGAAVSRIVAIKTDEKQGEGERALKTAVTITGNIGLFCTAFVFFFADSIAVSSLGDSRCALGLLCIAPASIFMGVSACIKGYFYGKGQIFTPASSEFIEQGIKIASISFFLKKGLSLGAEYGCAGVLLGLTVGELSSCLYLFIRYNLKREKLSCQKSQLLPILRLSLPTMVGAVGSSFFRMTEDIWIVRGFKRYGMDADKALGTYGLIHGMAMPLLVFPLTLISSFMAFLIPEISKAEKNKALGRAVKKVWAVASLCGGIIFLVFFFFCEEISVAVYGTEESARYIRPLCILCPVMILDSLSNGILVGLGEQTRLLLYGLFDSALRLGVVYFVLPSFGNGAIIAMIFLSNIITCHFTMNRVKKKAGINFTIKKAPLRMPKIYRI